MTAVIPTALKTTTVILITKTNNKDKPIVICFPRGKRCDRCKVIILVKANTYTEKPTKHSHIIIDIESSAIHLIQPHILTRELISDLLLCRPQYVFVNVKLMF